MTIAKGMSDDSIREKHEQIMALLVFFADMSYWHPCAKMTGFIRSLVKADHV